MRWSATRVCTVREQSSLYLFSAKRHRISRTESSFISSLNDAFIRVAMDSHYSSSHFHDTTFTRQVHSSVGKCKHVSSVRGHHDA